MSYAIIIMAITINFAIWGFHSPSLPSSLPLIFFLLLPGAITCFTETNCGGSGTSPANFHECCIGPGISYQDDSTCRECVGKQELHGDYKQYKKYKHVSNSELVGFDVNLE